MAMKTFLALVLASSIIALDTADSIAEEPGDESTTELVPFSEIEWEQLNPARGDKSPQAGTLWGDRKGTVPTGFLARFADGFSSPPHIHNATYRAVVISGLIHNDDPDAADMWMPAGSFWTQPKGEVHITAARGSTNVALVEIDKGPYLVLPVEEAFDSGERPVNVDVSNVVWVDLPGVPDSSRVPQVAYLWGSMRAGQSNGSFLKLPAGFTGKIHSRGSTFRAVVIQGTPQYKVPGMAIAKPLDPGSYFGSMGKRTHQISSQAEVDTIIYIRTDGKYDVIPVQS